MNGLTEFMTRLGAARIAAMAGVTLALIGFFAFVVMRVSTPQMVPLFAELTLADSAAIVSTLETERVPFEIAQQGTAILVPSSEVARLRMRMAEAGLPAGTGVGYEIFDKGDSLSATSFLQNVNRMRAIEGELARSIESLDRIRAARVHLVIPERPLFSRDATSPTASIVLRVAGTINADQIRAIRHLVASAVENLEPDRVAIIDEQGRLLADGAGEPMMGLIGADERITSFETRLKSQVEGIVERIVGAGRARAEVRAEMDLRQVTQTAESFDPETRVVRSTQTSEESSETTQIEDGVTVGNELPNAEAAPGEDGTREVSNRAEEVVNYEISKTVRTEVIPGGGVRRLSVAVLVDGTYGEGADGSITYTPRPEEEIERIGALVRSAIGFDESRGDVVEVINLRFAEPPGSRLPLEIEDAGFLSRIDMMRVIELGVLGLISLLVLLLVVRPMLRRALGTDAATAAALALPAPGESTAVADSGEIKGLPAPEESAASKMIALAQVNGLVQAQSIQRVGELVDQNPNETVAILRQWMNEPANA